MQRFATNNLDQASAGYGPWVKKSHSPFCKYGVGTYPYSFFFNVLLIGCFHTTNMKYSWNKDI